MDWLTRVPVVGPQITRLQRTHAWRAYERLDDVHWTRLAAAITFISFIALFPLITVAAAVGAAFLGRREIAAFERELAEQVPGIADRLDISGLVAEAGTVGAVAGVVLLATGVRWVGSLRECLRAVWGAEEDPGNPVLLRLRDAVVLAGLAVVGGVAMGGSLFASSAVGRLADLVGVTDGTAGRVLLFLAGTVISVLADLLLLAYVLTRLPRVHPSRRALLTAGVMGAVGFELLKLLLSGYLQGVASRSVYGAFGVPVALMLWINLMAKLLLYCAAWTATERTGPAAEPEPAAPDSGDTPEAQPERGTDTEPRTEAAPRTPAEPRPDSQPRTDARPDARAGRPADRPLSGGASAPEAANGDAPGRRQRRAAPERRR